MMRVLLDTNCWMQLVRERADAEDVRRLLAAAGVARVVISRFTLHGLGVLMRRHGVLDAYPAFLASMAIGDGVDIVDVAFVDLPRVVNVASLHRLDFDDAYQCVAAEIHDLKLVSFDADFDRTPRGRLTPAAALQLFKDEPT